MELRSSLWFSTFVPTNQAIYLGPPRLRRNANGAYWGEKALAADRDRILWKTKPSLAEQRALMKLHLITWLKAFLLIRGGARQTALRCVALRLAFERKKRGGKPTSETPPPPKALQPRRNASPGERAIRQQRQLKH